MTKDNGKVVNEGVMVSHKTTDRGGNLLVEMDRCCGLPREEAAKLPPPAARAAALPAPASGVDNNVDVVMDNIFAADQEEGKGYWPCFSCAA